jgi:hypothetical protein
LDTVGSETPASAAMVAKVMRRRDASSRLIRGTVGTVVARSGTCSLLDGTASPSRRFRNNFDNGIVTHRGAPVIYLSLHNA